MNHDQNNPHRDLSTWIEPELEARIVAWVAGEASAFEIAELERLVAEKPELAIFKRRIEAVHGLVAEAARPDRELLQLSAERRAKLLQAIGAPASAAVEEKPEAPVVAYPLSAARKPWRKQWWIVCSAGAAAACVMLALLLSTRAEKRFKSEEREVAQAKLETAPKAEALARKAMQEMRRAEAPNLAAPVTDISFVDKLSAPLNVPRADYAFAGKDEAARLKTQLADAAGSIQIVAGNGANFESQSLSGTRLSTTVIYNTLTGGGGGGGGGRGLAFTGGLLNKEVPLSIGGQAGLVQSSLGLENGVSFSATSTNADRAVTLGTTGAITIKDGSTLDMAASSVTLGAADRAMSATGDITLPKLKNDSGAITLNVASTKSLDDFSSSLADKFTTTGGAVALNSVSAPTWSGTELNQSGFPIAAGATLSSASPIVYAGGNAGSAMTSPVAPDGKIELSPFEVPIGKDKAYYATNTMAGTRLNSKLEDVGSSLSVLTKEQLAAATSAQTAASLTPPLTESQSPAVVVEGLAPAAKTAADADKKSAPAPARRANNGEPPPVERAKPAPPPVEETNAAKDPVSTFSLHVSDVSFRFAAAALARGELPDPARIRPEEFYNAFDYGDPAPAVAEKISCHVEQSAHPFLQQRNLVRIALRVPSAGRGAGTPLRLTVLLDTSGSMEREDRAASVKRAMAVLVSLLGPNDRVTLIGFARTPRLLAEFVPGNQAGWLVDLIARTPPEGGTNLEEALQLGGELALRHRDAGAQNRLVLLTDGAANLGNADPAQLGAAVERLRQQGLAFDACGVGLDGLDDEILESLTRKGDGRYYALNSADDADAGFARQLAGAFRPAAENLKLQVRFNPARVGAYRLIGFDQHRLREQDFRNDKVDAAELAADEAAVALYQVEALPQGDGELGEVFVRFRDPANGEMVERSWTLAYDAHAAAFDRATPSMQLAGTAALLAEKLRGGAPAASIKLADLAPVVNGLRGRYASTPRVQELAAMFAQMRRLSRE